VFCLFSSENFHARINRTGIGAGAGTIIDLNGKYWLKNNSAIEGHLSFSSGDWILLGGSYRLHNFDLFNINEIFGMSYGATAFIYHCSNEHNPFTSKDEKNKQSIGLALSAEIGLSYFPEVIPFEFYTDLGIGMNIAPVPKLFPHLSIGARIYLF
jgi:hypothetical protein